MSEPAIPVKEFEHEMASTRRLLERVPGEKGEWKPHPKSFALGHLVVGTGASAIQRCHVAISR